MKLIIEIQKYGDHEFVAQIIDPSGKEEMPLFEAEGTTAEEAVYDVLELIDLDMSEEIQKPKGAWRFQSGAGEKP